MYWSRGVLEWLKSHPKSHEQLPDRDEDMECDETEEGDVPLYRGFSDVDQSHVHLQ
jgi:hypothetical protein